MVKDILTGAGSGVSRIYKDAVLNNKIYFFADDGITGSELWSSDGTLAGTQLVKDLCPGSCPTDAENLIKVSDAIYFVERVFNGGIYTFSYLWRSRGDSASSELVKDLRPKLVFSDMILTSNNTLVMQLADDDDGGTGNQIWHLKPNLNLSPKMVLDLGDILVSTKTLVNDRVVVESVKPNGQPQLHWVK